MIFPGHRKKHCYLIPDAATPCYPVGSAIREHGR